MDKVDFTTISHWYRQAHWAECVAFAYQYPSGDFPDTLVELARAIMRRARENVERIVARLQSTGYRFVHPESALLPPRTDTSAQVYQFQALGLHVPLSLRVFWEEVGSVNLMGTHPEWPHAGYRFDSDDVWETDPLVVDPPDLLDDYENWRYNRDERGDDYPIEPFRIAIAPDAICKKNFSGGCPYAMSCDAPAVDSILLYEPQCISFVAYLRIAFEWGGFPGFRCYEDAPRSFIEQLKKDLVPL